MSKRKLKPQKTSASGFSAWLLRWWKRMHKGDSAGWLLVTALQALLTWGFMGLARLTEGLPLEGQVKMLVVVGIVVTWCMALRTIRARLLELLKQWNKAPNFFPFKASDVEPSDRSEKLKSWHRLYVRKSVLRLRIIAAGITMPFFILPVFIATLCLVLNWSKDGVDVDLVGMAAILTSLSFVVGGFFHWSVMPPATVSKSLPNRNRR